MAPSKSSYPLVAQAETLLIYGIFLFLTGLAQIGVTLGHRYMIEKATHKNESLTLLHFLPTAFTMTDIHLWYIYPSAALTLVPFLSCLTYAIFKRQAMTILICMSSLISFISSSIYVGLLIVHTLEYWQMMSSMPRAKANSSAITTTIPTMAAAPASNTRLLVSFDEPATFSNLALLVTFTLALVQALLSMIGAVIACLWSPCCFQAWSTYAPILTSSHCVQTTPHRFENPSSSSATLRTLKRQQQQQHVDTHRFLSCNGQREPMLNGFHQKISPIRSHYDDV